MNNDYLSSAVREFEFYKLLGDKTFAQIPDEALSWKYNEESNSIATIVKHLNGNMLSRFTDFLSSDGEKTWRNREQEFENDLKTRTEILTKWGEGWAVLLETLRNLQSEDLDQIVYIRNQGHTVVEAINRQLAHYSYHVGQIVFIGKMIAPQWTSLSIPKGASEHFNQERFSVPPHREHFTESYLKNRNNNNSK
jgi:hypothetical protein